MGLTYDLSRKQGNTTDDIRPQQHPVLSVISTGSISRTDETCYVSEHHPSSCFDLKHNVSETGFSFPLQVKPTQAQSIKLVPISGDRIQFPKHSVLNKKRTMDIV
jgi:hypothetical protein